MSRRGRVKHAVGQMGRGVCSATPVDPLPRPIEASKAAACYVRFTSTGAVRSAQIAAIGSPRADGQSEAS